MSVPVTGVAVAVSGLAVASPPPCPGVYRFYAADGQLLYVGKSVDLAARLKAHFQEAARRERHRRMMRQVARVECQPTAGEIGALLLENAAIKREYPLYNRRQRRLRQLWTLRLRAGPRAYLVPEVVDFLPGGERLGEVFGLYGSRHAALQGLRAIQREQALCPQVLGLEQGSAPCFQFQIRRCRGACLGQDGPAEHNARLLGALRSGRIIAWPFEHPVLLPEYAGANAHPQQPQRQWHLVHHWAYLGSFEDPDRARRTAAAAREWRFDRDCYRILYGALSSGAPRVLAPHSLREMSWPAYNV
jgi:excinuclease Cho